MSAIISDIRDDLQKLEELKKEIGEVRKALLGLNVKVEIVKKNELEERFRNLQNKSVEAMNRISASIGNVQKDISELTDISSGLESVLGRVASITGIAFSAAAAKSFVEKVRETRSYFQDIETSMEVFLGNQQKAADFTNKLKDYAYYNMFEFKDLAMASKQMIAYHTAIDDVIPELDKLSNIATGTKQPLMELVTMYNNARSVGKIQTQQLGMWARQGILVKETLKEMGQEVKKSGVTFEQLQMVIDKYTGEGGMFHNLMANQMSNISAEAGQLADTLDLMYDEIGQKYQDLFVKGYKAAAEAAESFPQDAAPVLDALASGAEYVIENFEKLAKILATLIATYGAYRSVVILTTVAQKAMMVYKAAQEFILMARCVTSAKDAMLLLNIAMKSNVIGIVISLVAAAATAFALFRDKGEEAADKAREFGDSAEQAASKVKSLFAILESTNSGTKINKDALSELVKTYSDYGITLDKTIMQSDDEVEKIKEVVKNREKLIDVIKQEAIEREAAERTSEANKKYGEEIANIRQKIKESIKGNWSDADKDMIVNTLVSEEYIEKISNARRKLEATQKMLYESGKGVTSVEWQKSAMEYGSVVESVNKKLERYAESLNEVSGKTVISSADIRSAKEAINDNRESLIYHKNALDDDLESTENARIAAEKASGAWDENTVALRLSKKTLSEIKTELDNIAARNKIDIDVNVRYNEENPMPEVLKKYTSEQWADRAREFTTFAATHPFGGTYTDKATGKTKYYTNQEATQEAYRAANEGKAKENQEETAKKNAERAKEEAERNAKSRAKAAARRAKEAADRRAKEIADELKYNEELEEIKKQGAEARAAADIAAIKNDGERERAERKAQHEKTKRDLEDQTAEIYKAIYEQRKRAYETQNKDKKYENTKAGEKGWDEDNMKGTLTDKEQEYFNARYAIVKAGLDKETAEYDRYNRQTRDGQIQAMRDYLKEYGSLEQQKYAITKEYDDKIAKESDASQKALLQKQKEHLLAELDMKQLQQSIDWEMVFDDLDRASTEALGGLRDKLRKMLNGGDVNPENAKVLSEKILEIENEIAERSSVWSSLIPALKDRERMTREVARAEEDAANAAERVFKANNKVFLAQNAAKDAIKNATGKEVAIKDLGNVEFIEKLRSELDTATTAGKAADEALANLAVAAADAATAQKEYTSAQLVTKNKKDILAGMGGGLGGIMSGAVDAAGGGALGIMNVANQNIQSMKDLVETMGLSETDFGIAVNEFASGSQGFVDAVNALASGDIVGAVNGVLEGVAGYAKGFTTLFAGSGNEKEKEAEIEKLSRSNEILAKSIDGLSEKILKSDSTNKESIEAYRKAISAEKEWEENQRKAINARASEWTNTGYGLFGLGGKSSFNAHMSATWEGWRDFTKVLNQNGINKSVSKNNIWSLTPEEMKLLRDFAPTRWKELFGGEGHKNPEELVNEYIERAGMGEKLVSDLNEKLTGYSWDGFLDSYKSMLKDLNSDNKTFADGLEEMLSNAILESLVNDEYKERIRGIYKMVADAADEEGDGGTDITEKEVNAIRDANKKLADDMIARRQQLIDLGLIKVNKGYDDQSASQIGVDKITSEQADKGIGILTAIQIATEQMRNKMYESDGKIPVLTATADDLRAIQVNVRDIASETRDFVVSTYLEVREINAHQAKIEKAVVDMQPRVAEIERRIKELA